MTKPNILFLITDQQRADSMGCYGNPAGTTPHIDQLAKDATVFDQAYCESPICMPSRTTLLTGKYAEHHGVRFHNTTIREHERTLADLCNEAGYYTHCIGKMHLYSQERPGNPESLPDWRHGKLDNYEGPFCGFTGADLILGHSNPLYGHYGKWLKQYFPDAPEAFWTDRLEPVGDPKVFGLQNAFRTQIPEEAHSSSYVAEMCKKVFQKATDEDQPFFCWASFPDPHWPVCPPGEWLDKFKNVALPPRIPYNGECEREDLPMHYRGLKNGRKYYEGGCRLIEDKNPEDMENIRRAYHAAVAFIDHNVGKIIDDLKQRGLYDNTIIVYTTDHGDYLGDHGLQAKGGFLYDSFIRTPMIIKQAQQNHGQRSAAPFSFIDVPETLCDLAQIPFNLASDGVSQASVCRDQEQQVREHCVVTHFSSTNFEEAPADQHAIIHDGWKLVYIAGDPNGLLFNNSEDPQELNNLWHAPEYQQKKQDLLNRLLVDLNSRRDKELLRLKHDITPGYHNHLMERSFWQEKEVSK